MKKSFAEMAAEAAKNGKSGTVRERKTPPVGRYYATCVWGDVKGPDKGGAYRFVGLWEVDHGPQLGATTFSNTRYDPTHETSVSILSQTIANIGHSLDDMDDLDGTNSLEVLNRLKEWIVGARAEINVKESNLRNAPAGGGPNVEARWINKLPENAPPSQRKAPEPGPSEAGKAMNAMARPKVPAAPATEGRPAI